MDTLHLYYDLCAQNPKLAEKLREAANNARCRLHRLTYTDVIYDTQPTQIGILVEKLTDEICKPLPTFELHRYLHREPRRQGKVRP